MTAKYMSGNKATLPRSKNGHFIICNKVCKFNVCYLFCGRLMLIVSLMCQVNNEAEIEVRQKIPF